MRRRKKKKTKIRIKPKITFYIGGVICAKIDRCKLYIKPQFYNHKSVILDFFSETKYSEVKYVEALPETPQKPKKAIHKQTHKERYHQYLLSPTWAKIRKKAMIRDKYECQDCYTKNGLQVHHLVYDNIFHEDLEDLITLCEKCHSKIHKK